MSRSREIERHLSEAAEHAGERVRQYANGATDSAHGLVERGRRAASRFGRQGHDVGRHLSRAAEDFADEANYQYRRLRRQVKRHPGATLAIAAGTIGAFLLLRKVFASHDDD